MPTSKNPPLPPEELAALHFTSIGGRVVLGVNPVVARPGVGVATQLPDRSESAVSDERMGSMFLRLLMGVVLATTVLASGFGWAWYFAPDQLNDFVLQSPNATKVSPPLLDPSMVRNVLDVTIVAVHDVGAADAKLEFNQQVPNAAAVLISQATGKQGLLRLLPLPDVKGGEPTKQLLAEWNQKADELNACELPGKTAKLIYFDPKAKD